MYCNLGDQICQGNAEILLGHLIYGLDAPAATEFIVGQTGF